MSERKMAKKGPKKQKKGEKYFCQNFHWVILVIVKGSSYMQNQQNAMNGLGEIGHNVNFWVKMDKFWPKKGQKDFCQNFHWVILVIDHKCSFNMQNQ